MLSLIDDIIEGASRRLRPIVITTATTVFGLLPTAYGIGGADPFIEPMVLALAYGIIVSTFITLILIPAFYMANLDGYFFGKRVLAFVNQKRNVGKKSLEVEDSILPKQENEVVSQKIDAQDSAPVVKEDKPVIKGRKKKRDES